MRHTTRHLTRLAAAATAVTAALTLAACGGGSDPLQQDPSATGTGAAQPGKIVVGSADFSESQLLAHLYTGALKAKGVNVGAPRLGIGAREAYLKGLTDGSVQIVPEYTGALALFYKKDFAQTEPQKVYEELKTLLPADLAVAAPSKAEDNDSMTVTKAYADEHQLTKVSDLAAVAGSAVLGAPPEFKTRAQGVPGLHSTYGITFREVRGLKGQALVQALKNGQVQVANVFTTDPAITANGFVTLQDDKSLFGAQNVVPLMAKSVASDQKVTGALDAVSAKLTTEELRALLKKVDVDKQDPSAVAQEWLKANDLA